MSYNDFKILTSSTFQNYLCFLLVLELYILLMEHTAIREHQIFNCINRKQNAMVHFHQTYLSISNTYKFGQSPINIDVIINKFLRKCNKIIGFTRIHNFLDQRAFNFLVLFFPPQDMCMSLCKDRKLHHNMCLPVEQWGLGVPRVVDTVSHFAFHVAPGSSSVLFYFYFREQTIIMSTFSVLVATEL